MLMILTALAAVQAAPPAQASQDADPVVCKRDRNSDVGTHMRPKPKCMKKSQWELVEKDTQQELQSFHERSALNPGRAEGHGGPH